MGISSESPRFVSEGEVCGPCFNGEHENCEGIHCRCDETHGPSLVEVTEANVAADYRQDPVTWDHGTWSVNVREYEPKARRRWLQNLWRSE